MLPPLVAADRFPPAAPLPISRSLEAFLHRSHSERDIYVVIRSVQGQSITSKGDSLALQVSSPATSRREAVPGILRELLLSYIADLLLDTSARGFLSVRQKKTSSFFFCSHPTNEP